MHPHNHAAAREIVNGLAAFVSFGSVTTSSAFEPASTLISVFYKYRRMRDARW